MPDSRYWTILSLSLWMWMLHGTVDPVACQRWLARLQPGGTVVTLVACALILAIRTWALYSHSTAMLFLCVFLTLPSAHLPSVWLIAGVAGRTASADA